MTGLTDRTISAIRPKAGKRITITDNGTSGVRGLSILANYTGSKIWYFRFSTPSGKQKRIRIGSYPSTSLVDARKKARTHKKSLEEGLRIDQRTSKTNLAKREIHTIGELWAEYHAIALTIKKSAIFENQMWNKHLSPHFGTLDVRSFTRDEILDFLLPFRRTHSPSLATRVQAIISQLGNYAVERRVLDFSPAYQLGKNKPLPTNDRFLSRYELAIFWNALSNDAILERARVSSPLANALKLALLTCARRTEVAGMEWAELDLVDNIWTIPSNRTKNKRALAVPLSDFTLKVVQDCRKVSRRSNSRFLFPGRRTEEMTKGKGHVRGDAVTRACSRLCQVLIEEYDIKKFSPHDLRRTGATYMASSLKVDRFIISQVLNHTSDKGGGASVTSVYARYEYLDEKRSALNAWCEFILSTAVVHQIV